MEKYFEENWEFGTARLVSKKSGYYLHIPMTKTMEIWDYKKCSDVIGVDLGMNFIATAINSMGQSFFYKGRHIKNKRAQFSNTRKRLQTRKSSSSRRRLKKIGQRENRWMRDVNHCVSKALVNNVKDNALIVLEDLHGIRSATEKVRLKDRYTSVSWAYFDLGQKILYKAELQGKQTIFVDPKYTSQGCPKCGHTERSNRDKKKHRFKCKTCGYQSNDDRIGAMNLQRKGIEYINSMAYQASPDMSGAQSIVPQCIGTC